MPKVTFSPRLRNSHIGMADPEVRVTKNAAKGHRRAYVLIVLKCYCRTGINDRTNIRRHARLETHWSSYYYYCTAELLLASPLVAALKRLRMRSLRRRQYKRAKFRKNQNGFSHTQTRPKRYTYTNTAPL